MTGLRASFTSQIALRSAPYTHQPWLSGSGEPSPLFPDCGPRSWQNAGRQQSHYVPAQRSGKKPLCSRIIIDILTFVTSFHSS